MDASSRPLFDFDNSFVREVHGLYEPWQAEPAPDPQLLVLNDALAQQLRLDPGRLRSADGVQALTGNATVEGSQPVAQAYAGHQFGGFSPRLGDGRALLLGEVHDGDGHRLDVHLKGSGRTPFARGGDGKAAVGPMLREYLISEAMHALDIPTTRSLAVVATGEKIQRDTMLPGAVLTRVAASHLRVGSFQFAAAHADPSLLERLADYAIARHYPDTRHADNLYLSFFERVLQAQAELVAKWMLVGFVHGVMNTDNMTISGETIDYGPCAFMDRFDPATLFSSIDHQGRYAYGNQPQMAQWNLARLAEALLPLIHPNPDTAVELATAVLHTFPERYLDAWSTGMQAKMGLGDKQPGDAELVDELLTLMHEQRVDYTSCLRSLGAAVSGDETSVLALYGGGTGLGGIEAWLARYQQRVLSGGVPAGTVTEAMNRLNPIYIPRNHLVEDALNAATDGDIGPFDQLVEVLMHPFEERPGLEHFATPATPSAVPYRTFCGT
ncbi:MAG: protein adenylyltransferase SelO [Acidimicrobiales bacterium]